jgi:hypothetical protein
MRPVFMSGARDDSGSTWRVAEVHVLACGLLDCDVTGHGNTPPVRAIAVDMKTSGPLV